MTKNLLPQFLVVGAAKSGTTSLFHYLNQHPNIFIPSRKECRFFSQMPGNFIGGEAAAFQNDVIRTVDEYIALFTGNELKIKGDISNDYLFYYKESVRNIKKYLSDNDVKIIIILRNPIDRAYSNYLHAVRLLSEPLSFEQAIVHEQYRKKMNYAWPFLYVEVGMYYQQVKHYVTNFSHVKLFLYEDLAKKTFLTELFNFLEVDRVQLDISCKHNVSTIPKYPWFSKFLLSMSKSKINRSLLPIKLKHSVRSALEIINTCKPPQLQKQTRLYLQRVFKNDIERLQQLIKRDLSAWINEE